MEGAEETETRESARRRSSIGASYPRQVRARRRRRRRQIGTLVFVLVAGGVLAGAYLALAGDDGSSDGPTETSDVTGATTTTAVPPFSGSYPVTDGINVRSGAGTTFPAVSTVEQGHTIVVACVAQGTPVNGPSGPNSNWLKVTGPGAPGYVSAVYVATGNDLNGTIPACPAG